MAYVAVLDGLKFSIVQIHVIFCLFVPLLLDTQVGSTTVILNTDAKKSLICKYFQVLTFLLGLFLFVSLSSFEMTFFCSNFFCFDFCFNFQTNFFARRKSADFCILIFFILLL